MTPRAFALLMVYLAIVVAGGFKLAEAIHAQALVDPVYAYTTADPIRADGIGLATHEGRFAISRGDDCAVSGIGPSQEVLYWKIEHFTGIGALGVVDNQGVVHVCSVRLEQLADPTPCFQDAVGTCDVALESGG